MSKILYLELSQEVDENEDITSQEVMAADVHIRELYENRATIIFRVHNLNECPEDAVIGRDLFQAADYVNTLQLGMKLAQLGYDSINLKEIKESE